MAKKKKIDPFKTRKRSKDPAIAIETDLKALIANTLALQEQIEVNKLLYKRVQECHLRLAGRWAELQKYGVELEDLCEGKSVMHKPTFFHRYFLKRIA